mmetsp:Transcript_27980/g.70544  ORF Transcript_27980/g.70544 Transcript_27980/m.70544 type:complete len:212 (+) Transcript_27980:181-816(+)
MLVLKISFSLFSCSLLTTSISFLITPSNSTFAFASSALDLSLSCSANDKACVSIACSQGADVSSGLTLSACSTVSSASSNSTRASFLPHSMASSNCDLASSIMLPATSGCCCTAFLCDSTTDSSICFCRFSISTFFSSSVFPSSLASCSWAALRCSCAVSSCSIIWVCIGLPGSLAMETANFSLALLRCFSALASSFSRKKAKYIALPRLK